MNDEKDIKENVKENNIDIKYIYMRAETLENEYRAPIVPDDVPYIVNNGITVYIESSSKRIYDDNEYESRGAKITSFPWYSTHWNNIKNDMIIVGIKELSNLDHLNRHVHCYFSHSFKKQKGSQYILDRFKNTSSIICDFEYFLNEANNRVITFSYFAGISGCILGIYQYNYRHKENNENKENSPLLPLKDLKAWSNIYSAIKIIQNSIINQFKIAIIGNGTSAKGVIFVLNLCGLSYTIIKRNDRKDDITNYDIIFNCIKLDDNSKEVFIDEEISNNLSSYKLVVDISCDTTKENNPFPICKEETTWGNPVFSYNKYLDIISISNLPSLLPKDSSDYFSNKLVELLFNPELKKSWIKALSFYTKIQK